MTDDRNRLHPDWNGPIPKADEPSCLGCLLTVVGVVAINAAIFFVYVLVNEQPLATFGLLAALAVLAGVAVAVSRSDKRIRFRGR